MSDYLDYINYLNNRDGISYPYNLPINYLIGNNFELSRPLDNVIGGGFDVTGGPLALAARNQPTPNNTPSLSNPNIGGYMLAAEALIDIGASTVANSRIKDTSAWDTFYNTNLDATINGIGDIDAYTKSMNAVPMPNKYDVGHNNSERANNIVSATAKGASAGMAVAGPWGAAIGGAIGGITSGIGEIVNHKRALLKMIDLAKARDLYVNRNRANLLSGINNWNYKKIMNTNFNKYDLGGFMNTNGMNEVSSVMSINNGGTHEENPLGGVPLDPQNRVELGEKVINLKKMFGTTDGPLLYVLSNSLEMSKELKDKYNIKDDHITYAKGFEKITKASLELKDPITLNGDRVKASDFISDLETTKEEKDRKTLKRQLAKMSPLELLQLLMALLLPLQLMLQPQQPQMEEGMPLANPEAEMLSLGMKNGGVVLHRNIGPVYHFGMDYLNGVLNGKYNFNSDNYYNALVNDNYWNENYGDIPKTINLLPEYNSLELLNPPINNISYPYKLDPGALVPTFELLLSNGLRLSRSGLFDNPYKSNTLLTQDTNSLNKDPNKKPVNWADYGLKYLPLGMDVALTIASLFDTPDYSSEKAMIRRLLAMPNLTNSFTAEKLRYTPADTHYKDALMLNLIHSNKRDVNNLLNGNGAEVINAQTGANASNLQALADADLQYATLNANLRLSVVLFNNGVDSAAYNAQLAIDAANLLNYQNKINALYALDNAMKQERGLVLANRNQAVTNLIGDLLKLNKENWERENFNALVNSGYFGTLNDAFISRLTPKALKDYRKDLEELLKKYKLS